MSIFKKFLSVALALCFSLSASTTAFAVELGSENTSISEQMYPINVAHIQNVNETGTNIADEFVDGTTKVIPNTNAIIGVSVNEEISVSLKLNNENLVITGIPAGRSESGKTIFFTGTSSNPNYEVVNFAYVLDTSKTNMYFKETKAEKHPMSNTMLKLYIKDSLSDTRDFYFVEVFDIILNYSSGYIQGLTVNPLLGAWAARQFAPTDEYFGEDTTIAAPRASSSTKYWYCTKSYYDMGENQTHTIRWRTNVDYSNIIKGQEANQYYRLTVYAKNSSYSVNTDLNSDTMSYLHVDGIRLCQTSVPNTAWKSTTIDGEVQNNGWFGELSASIGVSYGVLSLSYSIPLSFENIGTVDINETYTGYENGVGGQYTRSIETEMDSDFKLTQIGYYFEVVSVLRDYGNVVKSADTLKATWYVDIINAGTMETCPHTCTHNVSVSITG